jgi:Xaa-Pro aminopeptidase
MTSHWPYASSFFERNRNGLTNLMEPDTMAVLFSNDQMPRNGDQYFPFRQSSDFFHQTGITQEKSMLILFPNCPVERFREVLFIMRPNEHLERWEGRKLSSEQATAISGIKTVLFADDFEGVLHEMMFYAEQVYLDNNESVKFNPDVPSRALRCGLKIHHDYPFHQYRRLAPILSKVRAVKCETEIAMIREACKITGDAFRRAAHTVKPGVGEYEIQAEIEHEFRIRRASGHAFPPIIATGLNGTYLHYNHNNAICRDGELLLMDFGCEYFGYASDLSRTIPVNGLFTPRQKTLYQAVLSVYKKAMPLFRKGQTILSIQNEVNLMMQDAMLSLGLITSEEIKKQDPLKPALTRYFPHGVSHHVGLDVHDPGRKQDPLAEGMVLTLEPGLYIPEEATGIRIETDLLITQGKPLDLFGDLEVEVEEIEELLRK